MISRRNELSSDGLRVVWRNNIATVDILANQLLMSIDDGLKIVKSTRMIIGNNINCKSNMQIYICGPYQYLSTSMENAIILCEYSKQNLYHLNV